MRLIFSCTTTPDRLDVFCYVVQSLLLQSRSLDILLVNLDKDVFDDQGSVAVPEWLRRDEITVKLVEDVRPFTKLLPALFIVRTEALTVAGDDDVLYGWDWFKGLVRAHEKQRECVVRARARLMRRNIFGGWTNDSGWSLVQRPNKGPDLLPLGVGGVIFTKQLLDMSFVTDRTFLTTCPANDTAWSRMIEYVKAVDPGLPVGKRTLSALSGAGVDWKARPEAISDE